MNEMNFNEEDKQKTIEFLNMVSKYAKFELNTQEVIQYFKLISHMQQRILPKIDANILEIKRVIEPKESSKDASEIPAPLKESKSKGKK